MDLLSNWEDTTEPPPMDRDTGRAELAALLDGIAWELSPTRPAIEHPESTGFFNVVSDGSFYEGANVAGAGAVIAKPESDEFDQKVIHKLKGKQTSVSAEIMAAVHALQDIPPGSSVWVHTDCQALCKAIKLCTQMSVDDFISFNAQIKNRPERFAWGQLYSAVTGHREVLSSYINPFDTELQTQLSRADGLAKAAAKSSAAEMLAYEKKQARKQKRYETGRTRLEPMKGRGSRSQIAAADIETSRSDHALTPAA